jgi:hypothetical protein
MWFRGQLLDPFIFLHEDHLAFYEMTVRICPDIYDGRAAKRDPGHAGG